MRAGAFWLSCLILSTCFISRPATVVVFECPSACICAEVNNIDCSNVSLISLPVGFPNELKILNLSNNYLQNFNAYSFDQTNFPNLEVLDLSYNSLGIVNFVPSLFPSLKYLYLESCNLTTLSFTSGALENLTHINLKSNRIENVKENLFGNFQYLNFVDLSFNNINLFPSAAFSKKSAVSVKELLLNNNEIELLPINCFQNLTALETLNLSKNKLRRFPTNAFVALQNLQYLDLSGNRLKRIPGLSFKGLQNLRVLRLERNGLSSLSDGAFWDVPRLTDLFLSHNKLTSIDRGWLYGLQNLLKLHIHHNLLTHIDYGGWQFSPKLIHLDLSRNHLKSLRPKTFHQLSNLKELSLARNQISQIYENAFLSLNNLKTLDLSNNVLADVLVSGQAVFKELINLKTLKLNGNGLVVLPSGSFEGLSQLVRLELSDNALVVIFSGAIPDSPTFNTLVINSDSFFCDCHASWLVDLLSASKNSSPNLIGRINCRHPLELAGLSLRGLDANLTCTDEQTLRFEQTPENKTLLRGKDFSFECRVRCQDCRLTFVWRKNGQLLYPDPENGFRITTTEVESGGVWKSVLSLESVDESDSGYYMCQVTSQVATILSERANLVVHVPPEFTKRPNDVVVSTGDTARLECSATGSPTPMLSWKKDGGDNFPAATERRMHVMPTDDVFFIVNAKVQDSGLYTCFAKSSAGTVKTEARLYVNAAPPPLETTLIKTVNEGETAVFECNANRSRTANGDYVKIVWSHNGQVLHSDTRRHLATDGKLLVILQTVDDDQGFYTCRSGEFVQSARLAVLRNAEENAKKSGDKKPPEVKQSPAEPAPTPSFDPTSTAGVVVIVVITCVVLTSLAWVLVIWRSRRSPAVVLALRRRSSVAFEAVANVRV